MPTILREGAYRLKFYSHEPNEPPHVHIDRDELSIKVWLEPVTLAANHGFRPHEINDIIKLVTKHRSRLLEAWHEYFNQDNR
jgi:hypothetical protein